MDIDLMILFNGFIRNYVNLGLSIYQKSKDIIDQENRYFITLGKLLGYFVSSNKSEDGSIEINWKEYEFNTISTSSTKVNITREVDLSKDISVIHGLINKVNSRPNIGYVVILEVSSFKRIDFLNNIISSSLKSIKYEVLIIYNVRDVIKNIFHYDAYLFKDSETIKNKVGISSIDKDGNLKAIFKV